MGKHNNYRREKEQKLRLPTKIQSVKYEDNRLSYGRNRTQNKPKTNDFDAKWKDYIGMAYSCRSFEVWLLLHFERDLKVYTTSKDIIAQIRTYAPLYEKGICEVKKGQKATANAYEILLNNPIAAYETTNDALSASNKAILAIENSAWLKNKQQYLVEQNNNRFWGINPFTNVDDLLCELLEQEKVQFEKLGHKIIEQDWNLTIDFDSENHQIHIQIELAEKQRLLITNANFKDFFWIQILDNQSITRIMPIQLLSGTLNLPTTNGERKGNLRLQFPNNLPKHAITFHFKWKMQKFIIPIFDNE